MKIALFNFAIWCYAWGHTYSEMLEKILKDQGHEVEQFGLKGIWKIPMNIKPENLLSFSKRKNDIDKVKNFDIVHFMRVSETWTRKELSEKADSKLHDIVKHPDFPPYVFTVHTIKNCTEKCLDTKTIVDNSSWIITTVQNIKDFLLTNKDVNLDLTYYNPKYFEVLPFPFHFEQKKLEWKIKKENIFFNCTRFVASKRVFEVMELAEKFKGTDYKFVFYWNYTKLWIAKNNFTYGIAWKNYNEKILKLIKEKGLEDMIFMLDWGKYDKNLFDRLQKAFPWIDLDRVWDKFYWYEKAKFWIDLSFFMDRDRPQYTTLEAMQCQGVPLVHVNYTGPTLVNWKNVIGFWDEVTNNKRTKWQKLFDYELMKNQILNLSQEELDKIIENNEYFLKEVINPWKVAQKFIDFYNKVLKKWKSLNVSLEKYNEVLSDEKNVLENDSVDEEESCDCELLEVEEKEVLKKNEEKKTLKKHKVWELNVNEKFFLTLHEKLKNEKDILFSWNPQETKNYKHCNFYFQPSTKVCQINVWIDSKENWYFFRLYINNDKSLFEKLKSKKEELEEIMGQEIEFIEKNNRKATELTLRFNNLLNDDKVNEYIDELEFDKIVKKFVYIYKQYVF